MITEASALRMRPGQFLEVVAKAEAKDKAMNKKYQMMSVNIWVQNSLVHRRVT